MFAAPTSGPPGQPPAGRFQSTEEGLPRRVRQANLAPQLRHPVTEVAAMVPHRSPEQVRSLMSALQLGTTRGRIEASRYRRDERAGGEPSSPADGRSEMPPEATAARSAEATTELTAARSAETTTELTAARTAELTAGLRSEPPPPRPGAANDPPRRRRSESPRRRRPGSPEDPASRDAEGSNQPQEGEEKGIAAPGDGTSFADAATVSFPAIVNVALARGEAPPGTEGAAGDRAEGPGDNDVTRPDKDAQ